MKFGRERNKKNPVKPEKRRTWAVKNDWRDKIYHRPIESHFSKCVFTLPFIYHSFLGFSCFLKAIKYHFDKYMYRVVIDEKLTYWTQFINPIHQNLLVFFLLKYSACSSSCLIINIALAINSISVYILSLFLRSNSNWTRWRASKQIATNWPSHTRMYQKQHAVQKKRTNYEWPCGVHRIRNDALNKTKQKIRQHCDNFFVVLHTKYLFRKVSALCILNRLACVPSLFVEFLWLCAMSRATGQA